jgi:hypothetical protein
LSYVFGQKNNGFSGLYGECEIGFFACMQIDLDPNGSFEYFIFFDVGGGRVLKGNWNLKEDTLILNTFDQPKQLTPTIINDYDNKNDSITIRIFDQDSINLWLSQLVINNLEYNCDTTGVAKIPKQIIDEITVHFLNQSYTIKINNKDFKDISIFVPLPISVPPAYLTNEKWLVKGKKLFPYFRFEKGYDKKCYLEKTEAINKRF